MDRFERGGKGKTEEGREVVKESGNETTSADSRREAAVAGSQTAAEQPAGEPPIVVDNPLPGEGGGPGVVTEIQSLAPEQDASPQLVVPLDDDDQDEDDASGSDPDAESGFMAGPDPASLLLPAVQAVSQEPLSVAGEESAYQSGDDLLLQTGSSGLLVHRLGDDVVALKDDELDPGTSIPPDLEVIDYPDFLDVQLKADGGTVQGPSGTGDDAVQFIDGDPDRPILAGYSTGELDRGPVMSNTTEPQPIDPQVSGGTGAHTASEDPGETMFEDHPLEFIIGDGGSMFPNWSMSGDDAFGPGAPDNPSADAIGEATLEFKSTSGMDAEPVANEAAGVDSAGVALGGPDTTERIVGLPDTPNVGDGLPETDPLDMTKADVISEISAEPLAYNQAETLASSFADDDDDPLDGL